MTVFLVDLADQNARHLLEEFKLAALEADERAVDPVYELQRELGLPRLPRSLICFDISHAQGTDVVASGVWFENGRPKRAEYRKFKIASFEGNDDFRAMHEVVTRYFTRRTAEEKPLPDLVVIDGGKGQLSSAKDALDALGLAQLVDQQLDGLLRVQRMQYPAQLPDDLELLWRQQDLFFTGA